VRRRSSARYSGISPETGQSMISMPTAASSPAAPRTRLRCEVPLWAGGPDDTPSRVRRSRGNWPR
jgi:hypothetical protein